MTFTEAVVRFVRWLRAGYPDWAPGEGYAPRSLTCPSNPPRSFAVRGNTAAHADPTSQRVDPWQ
jgi:hypothetical protein